jgi:hypothetical protein
VPDDRRRGPGHIDERSLDHIPVHAVAKLSESP